MFFFFGSEELESPCEEEALSLSEVEVEEEDAVPHPERSGKRTARDVKAIVFILLSIVLLRIA